MLLQLRIGGYYTNTTADAGETRRTVLTYAHPSFGYEGRAGVEWLNSGE